MSANKALTSAKKRSFIFALVVMAGCAANPNPKIENDPYESANRKVHAFNKGFDTVVSRPLSIGYDAAVPDPLETGISNFAGNLGLPGQVVNNLLQFELADAGKNTLSFVINSTLGFGGLFDPASHMGLRPESTGFDQTLASWGIGQGSYLELPVVGASSQRGAVALVTGIALGDFLNPVGKVLTEQQKTYRSVSKVGERLQARHEFDRQIDAVLYKSADSYAQQRSIYLQKNGQSVDAATNNEDDFDPYEGIEELE